LLAEMAEQELEEEVAEAEEWEEMAEEDQEAVQDMLEEDGAEAGFEEVVENGVEGNEDEDALEDEEEEEVQEHLKDAVEASLRVKRLLGSDNLDESSNKKRRREDQGPKDVFEAKVNQLLTKWALKEDLVTRHVLENLSMEEIQNLVDTNYTPDKFNQWKSPAELLAKYSAELKERKSAGGGPVDPITAFRFRWKLDVAADKTLRTLTHKELRHVLNVFDSNVPLADVIEEARETPVPDEGVTEDSMPDNPGVATMTRFGRLELIDPVADAAVFGDANLTFSVKLAKHRKALGHVGRVIATTFEDLETLKQRYKEIEQTIEKLEEHYAEVLHGVDCTRIALDPQFEGMEGSLGAVYYNYPHSGAISGFFDGHPLVNWRHENLMRLFFRALRSFVKPGGVVKVASNMGAVGVRYSYIVGGAVENEFIHTETIPFLEWHLHRYGRSYGDRRDAYKRPDDQNNQSYNAQRAEADMVYCFCYQPSGDTLPQQMVRFPPTLSTLSACNEGPFKNLQGEAKKNLAKQLHGRFVKECSGTHVG